MCRAGRLYAVVSHAGAEAFLYFLTAQAFLLFPSFLASTLSPKYLTEDGPGPDKWEFNSKLSLRLTEQISDSHLRSDLDYRNPGRGKFN